MHSLGSVLLSCRGLGALACAIESPSAVPFACSLRAERARRCFACQSVKKRHWTFALHFLHCRAHPRRTVPPVVEDRLRKPPHTWHTRRSSYGLSAWRSASRRQSNDLLSILTHGRGAPVAIRLKHRNAAALASLFSYAPPRCRAWSPLYDFRN